MPEGAAPLFFDARNASAISWTLSLLSLPFCDGEEEEEETYLKVLALPFCSTVLPLTLKLIFI